MGKMAEILEAGRAPGVNTKAGDPSDADRAVPRALREMEQQMGTSQLERKLDMKASRLRKIWPEE
jgi:hypothetical protein